MHGSGGAGVVLAKLDRISIQLACLAKLEPH